MKRSLTYAVADVQAALDNAEIEIGTAEAIREVLDAVDQDASELERWRSANKQLSDENDELRGNLCSLANENDDLRRKVDQYIANGPTPQAVRDRYEREKADLQTKIDNQANTIKQLLAIKEFREGQLSAIAMALKARP